MGTYYYEAYQLKTTASWTKTHPDWTVLKNLQGVQVGVNTVNWEVLETPTYVVLKPLKERLDSALAPGFRSCVAELAQSHNKTLVLDLNNVEFMDSSGLGAVVSSYKLVQGVGGLVVCNMQPQVKDIFRLTHMDRIFEVNDGFDDCVEKLAA